MTKFQKLTIIFLLSTFYFLPIDSVSGASLYLMPQAQTVYYNDSFIIEVWLDSEGEKINAIETNFIFPTELLEVRDLSTGNSILTLWVKEPSFSNQDGAISFVGGRPKEFSGQGIIGKTIFLAKKIGKAEINFKDDSKVLLADGKGTPAKLNFLGGNYEILERPKDLPNITSSSHPDQNKWHKENTLHLDWDLIEGAEYSFILTEDALAEPDEIPDGTKEEIEYKGLEDGIYYFVLKQKLPGKDWSKKVTFRTMIDSALPEEFEPEITQIEGKNYLVFAAIDETSGIDHYEILEGGENWERGESPYLLKNQSLKSIIEVKAIDKAGNERIEKISPKIPTKFNYRPIILGLIVGGIIFWIFKKYKPKMKKIFLFLILFSISFFVANSVFGQSASLYLSPSSGTFFVGNTFDISVFVNTGGGNINAVRVDLKFDPRKLQIVTPTTGKSFIGIWISQPTFSNVEGTASFQGGIPSPGVNTSAGLVSTITFRAIIPAETIVSILDSSLVLLDDGRGTNILKSMEGGIYKITIPPPEGPKVFSPTHPDPNKWYKNNNPTFIWEKEDGVTDFSYSMDNSIYGTPDNTSEGDQTSVSFTNLEDGIWYFHLKAKKGGVWGGISHYLVLIDATPPADFSPSFEPILIAPDVTSRKPTFSFMTTDALSGIDYYELKVLDTKTKTEIFSLEASSPYKISALDPGEYEAIVRAYDLAGNWRDAPKTFVVIPDEKAIFISQVGVHIGPIFLPWLKVILILLFIIGIILVPIVWQWRKSKSKEIPLLSKT